MSTTYTPAASADRSAPLAPAATRYSGAAALCAAIRAAAALAPEVAPESEYPERYGATLYPFTVPAVFEVGTEFRVGPVTQRGREMVESEGPASYFPRCGVHPEAPGPFLAPRSDVRAVFAYSTPDGARGSLTVANLRAPLLALADKVHAQRGAFDGKTRRAAKPAKTPAGSSPHVTARALLESGDLAGALQMADAHGPAFIGCGKAPGTLYMQAQAAPVAGLALTIARGVASGRFTVLGDESARSITPAAPARADFARFSDALAWLESMAADTAWLEKLTHAIGTAPAWSQADARRAYESAGASAAPACETAAPVHETAAPATVAPEPAPEAPDAPKPARQVRDSAPVAAAADVLARISATWAPDAGRARAIDAGRRDAIGARAALAPFLQRAADNGAPLERAAAVAALAAMAPQSPAYAFPADMPPATHSATDTAGPVCADHPTASGFSEVSNYWDNLRLNRGDPTDYQTHLMQCMESARAEGLFYNSETYPRAAALMAERYGYPDARSMPGERSGDAREVVRDFGTHCYVANEVLCRTAEKRANAAAAGALKLGALPVLMFNDYKRCTGAVLHSFTHTGDACRVTFKRGRVAMETTCTAVQLKNAIERAAERAQRNAAEREARKPARPLATQSHSEPEAAPQAAPAVAAVSPATHSDALRQHIDAMHPNDVYDVLADNGFETAETRGQSIEAQRDALETAAREVGALGFAGMLAKLTAADEPAAPAIEGLDVAELGPEALAEFDTPTIEPQRAAELQERARASVARPTPSLRIPGGDLRSRIPARFAPLYLVRA